MKRTVAQLAEVLELQQPDDVFCEVIVEGASINTRTLVEGNLFIPFKGEKVDGHQYVKQAFVNGAAATLWQEGVPNPPENVPVLIVKDPELALQKLARIYRMESDFKVVAITGSNGKTTTKDMIAGVLSTQYKVQKTEGNLNNQLGLPLTLLGVKEDTEVAVLEMGMSGFREIALLSEIAQPDIAVITNIGESHLQDLGSREGIAKAKFEITEGLSDEGILFYYGDEPLLQELVDKASGLQAASYGYGEQNGLYPKELKVTEQGSEVLLTSGRDQYIQVPVLGRHNVLNALAAVRVGLHLGLSLSSIARGIKSMKLTGMRMERVEGAKGEIIINDAYNASPTSMHAAIQFAEDMTAAGKKIVVLGDMLELGDEEAAFHRKIGNEIRADRIDYVLTYGDRAHLIAEEAAKHFPSGRVRSFRQDKEELIKIIKQLTAENDLVLVKGSRGMALEVVVEALQKT
ncbi:UDP-N-acetylmuramoyl-tripeptide--D-alanyl-D-alanine ligase [Jeotgalibacillus soli]|uniref:UDP-N-acetylmuramoyl-tripeptide--D-alanyl-D-alanine ligase n=1 Tax=Jeotgalibacillus soli TaxID=889306 RepID=A0A0C2W6I5_9BACL|nr:UDP-N-acetylmuramoyl-tripeptide--D-alanyl-D-alanine ligase [Jeotgalibacillus soli]KIL52191.1 UDP-N-acetylmuramoyl-tripeptide--D-alanyl-D-alanine ligase [Jeotgalibacillus soli]